MENHSSCGFIWRLISPKPADLYLQYLYLFWKKSKCPLNWAGGQHNLPILFVTTRLMGGLALNLLVTSFTWGCLSMADNNGSVLAVAVPLPEEPSFRGEAAPGWSCITLKTGQLSPKPNPLSPSYTSWAILGKSPTSLNLSLFMREGPITYFTVLVMRKGKKCQDGSGKGTEAA